MKLLEVFSGTGSVGKVFKGVVGQLSVWTGTWTQI